MSMQTPYRKPGKFSQIKLDPIITEGKYQELTRTLERLKKTQPAAAAEVSRLAELGDFSENAEYQLAKGKLRGINQRILVLENQLRQAEVISPKKQHDTVTVGSTVVVETQNKTKTYQILGSSETDPKKGIISHNSPLGEALVGKRVGETITIKIGTAEASYTIRSIS